MYDRIFIVSEKRNAFYELSDLIPEMSFIEGISEGEAIDYFMQHMEGSRYARFPSVTPNIEIAKWITADMGLTWRNK